MSVIVYMYVHELAAFTPRPFGHLVAVEGNTRITSCDEIQIISINVCNECRLVCTLVPLKLTDKI
jgi:hypothetical protein